MALHHVAPGGRKRILEIRHEYLGPGVEGIDHHAPINRAGDFAAPIGEVRGCRGHLPVRLAYVCRFLREVGHLPGIERGLHLVATFQQAESGGIKLPVQFGHETQGLSRKHLLLPFGGHFTGNFDPFDLTLG